MKQLTLVFLVRSDEVLLAMKKRGFGAGRWNGLGGKVAENELIEAAMKREAYEEAAVKPEQYQMAARITFDEQGPAGRDTMHVSVYICTKWEDKPTETEEMAPKWFKNDRLPLNEMWDDDKYWLRRVLAGEKLICHFQMDDNDKVASQEITPVESL